MKTIGVLGVGRVGSAIVRDLAREEVFRLTVVDRDPAALAGWPSAGVRTLQADLEALDDFSELLAGCDLVVCAVPGFMGYRTLEKVLRAGKPAVDISFFPEDPFSPPAPQAGPPSPSLDELARERGLTAVVDAGLAPGLCNVLAGHVQAELDAVERYACYVGGLPRVRRWPFEYKAVFSPLDVIEEYTRPVHLVEGGRELVKPALSEVELLDFPEVGTLEAFLTDGLRTLRRTLGAPFMVEKTLRWPGHAALMRVLRESGFFETEPLEVAGACVAPRALTARLLARQWQLEPGEEDLTVMRVVLEGRKGSQRLRYTYELLDRYDPDTDTTSMARTTGYTCTGIVRQLVSGEGLERGVLPPERLGANARRFAELLDHLARRGVRIQERVDADS